MTAAITSHFTHTLQTSSDRSLINLFCSNFTAWYGYLGAKEHKHLNGPQRYARAHRKSKRKDATNFTFSVRKALSLFVLETIGFMSQLSVLFSSICCNLLTSIPCVPTTIHPEGLQWTLDKKFVNCFVLLLHPITAHLPPWTYPEKLHPAPLSSVFPTSTTLTLSVPNKILLVIRNSMWIEGR